jgi:hypothetical protein
MKKLGVTLALIMTLTGLVRAEETNKVRTPSLWSYSGGTILMSKYYGTIFGGTFYPGPMSFTDFNAVRKNRFGNFTLTGMVGQKLDHLDTYNVDGGNEYDIGFSQTFTFGSARYPVLVDAGALYLFLYDLEQTKGDAFDEAVRFDFPIRADRKSGPLFQPYYQLFHYHTVGSQMKSEGLISYAGVIRDQSIGIKLFGNELKLNFDYRMGINMGVYDSEPGIEYHRLSVSLPVVINKWCICPSLIGQLQGGPHQTYVHKNEIFYTLSVRRSF